MKKKPPADQWSFSAMKTPLIMLIYLLFIALLCNMASITKIHLQNLVMIDRSSFIRNLTHNSKPHSNDPLEKKSLPSPNFRLLIGILTLPDQYRRRDLLRLVYGVQSPVGAQVDVMFVFCNLTKEDQKVLVALEIMRYSDIIILNCAENMNGGKTYTYFSSLPEILGYKYDYVMKADDDIYFRLDRLVESLGPLPRVDMYYGFVIPCRAVDPNGHYMAGMGYILSWDLVDWIRTADIARNRSVGTEDRLVGEWLKQGGRGKNRYNVKPAMYNYPGDDPADVCSHDFVPETIAVHHLKDQVRWIKTLQYFNVTDQLKPSKFYHIP